MKFKLEILKDIQRITKELSTGLRALTFADNYDSFEIDLEWDSSSPQEELSVRNQLTTVPERYIIVNQTGNALITKGDTAWNVDTLYFKNNDTTKDVMVKIIVLR